MKYEILKRSHLKRNIIIALIVVGVISAIILNFTRAKYRTTESIPLIQGTINFSPSDFNILAFYLNKGTETISADKAPHVGYTLNTEQSTCEVNDKDAGGEIVYEDGNLSFMNMNYKGTKCSVYFDLIPDSENPVINSIGTVSDDTSITVTVDATDNIGIFYYYYKLDNEEEIRIEENSYTFEGLEKDSVHTITVRVEDAAGNEAILNKKVVVGYNAGDVILFAEGGFEAIKAKGTPDFSQVATTDEGMYAAEDDYGTSYYYRGAVNDNWFRFGKNTSGQPLYWRIIRVNGDGTIRMIFNGTGTNQVGSNTMIDEARFNNVVNNNMYVGYMFASQQVHGLEENSNIKLLVDKWYDENLLDQEIYLSENSGFCGDRVPSTSSSNSNGSGGTGTTITYYASYIRLVNVNKVPTLKCTYIDEQGFQSDLYTQKNANEGNRKLEKPIGLVTVDEVAMAGGVYGVDNSKYYLYNGGSYWTMSPFNYGGNATVFRIEPKGNISSEYVTNLSGVRPVINLRNDVPITGSGTTTDPFRVVGAS